MNENNNANIWPFRGKNEDARLMCRMQNPTTLFMAQIQRLDRRVIEHFEFTM